MSTAVLAWVLSLVGAGAFVIVGMALSKLQAANGTAAPLPLGAPPADLGRLEAELASSRDNLRVAETGLAAAQAEAQAAARGQAAAEAQAQAASQGQAAAEAQAQAAGQTQSDAATLVSDAPQAGKELAQLRASYETKEVALRSAQAAQKSSESEQASLKARLDRSAKRSNGLLAERDSLAKSLQEMEASTGENATRLRDALSAQTVDFEAIQKKVQQLSAQLQEAREQHRDEAARQEELTSHTLEAEQTQVEQSLRAMEATKVSQERTLQEQSTQLSLAQEEVRRLSAERNKLRDEAHSSSNAAASDSDSLERVQREISASNEALNARTRALEASRDEVAQLKAQVETAPAADSGAQEGLERVGREVAALKEELAAKKRGFEETREELAQLRHVATELEASVELRSQLEAELEQLRTEVAAAQTNVGITVKAPSAPIKTAAKAVKAGDPVSTLNLQEFLDEVQALDSVRAAAVADTSGLVVAGAGAEGEILSAIASTLYSAAQRAEKELPIGTPIEFSLLDGSGLMLSVRSASSQYSRLLFVTLSKGGVDEEESVKKLVAAIPRVSV